MNGNESVSGLIPIGMMVVLALPVAFGIANLIRLKAPAREMSDDEFGEAFEPDYDSVNENLRNAGMM